MWMVLPCEAGMAAAASRFKLLDDLEVGGGLGRRERVLGTARHGPLALGGGNQRLLARGLLLLPPGREETHAAHALDRLQQVHRPADGPPAIARGLHEAEAAAQLRVVEGGRVAHE